MFLIRRPSTADIDRFIDRSRDLPLSYGPIGIVRDKQQRGRFDEEVTVIGHGPEDFGRARAALMAWRQFDIGWVKAFPAHANLETGLVVAVLIRHVGFWSLNGARVLYFTGEADGRSSFGFAYGTLTNHAESGEELFEVFVDPQSGDVMYRIRAVSWPQTALTRIGQPFVRLLQARFRRHSAAAMTRAASAGARRKPRLQMESVQAAARDERV